MQSLSKKEIEELRAKNPDINIPEEDLKIDSFNKMLEKSYDNNYKSIKEIKKELNLTDSDIAEMFGYKSAVSYRNSSRKANIEMGIEKFYHLIKP
jgi:hypothetical protein